MVPRTLAWSLSCALLLALAGGETEARETADPIVADARDGDPAGGAALAVADTRQILPPSPVPGGNDPNASDDVLYVLEANDEENARRQRLGRKAHFFVNPLSRLAANATLSPSLTIEAFATSGLAAFDKTESGFGPRTSSVSGGLNATGKLPLFNISLAYEHRDARTGLFGPWSATSDKVGVTVNRTYPLFVRNLGLTPQLQASHDVVNPNRSSAVNIEGMVGLTYDASSRLSLAASIGYQTVFLYGVPGDRHDDGLKLLLGATFRATERLVVIAGATTTRTAVYGLPTYRADGSISPSLTAKYQILPGLTASVVANYGRFVSTETGLGTFKYNINPSIALTIPL